MSKTVIIFIGISLFASLVPVFPKEGWDKIEYETQSPLEDVVFADTETGWIVGGENTILYTSNGGDSWNAQKSPVDAWFYSIHFDNENVGWALGYSNGSVILHTMDGGKQWNLQYKNENAWLYDIFFSDNNYGWVVGYPNIILHTTDGGKNWTHQDSESDVSFFGLTFVNKDRGWIVGETGEIQLTENGGETWRKQYSGTNQDLLDVFFISQKTGWIVGASGTVLWTTNGGSNWIKQDSPVTSDLEGVFFIDANVGWAVGNSGTIIHTKNGGITWELQASHTSVDLKSVCFPSGFNGWAVGKGGTILKYTGPSLVVSDDATDKSVGYPFGFLHSETSRSWQHVLKIRNNGSESFTIDHYETALGEFSVTSPAFPLSLNPSQDVDVHVNFTPTYTGFYDDSLRFSITGKDSSVVHNVNISAGVLLSQNSLQRLLYHRAIAAYDSSIYYDAKSSAVHNNLGVIYCILNSVDRAHSEFSASSIKGTEMNMGVIDVMRGDHQLALNSWSALLKDIYTPEYMMPQIKYNIAWLYDDMSEYDSAYVYYSDVVSDKKYVNDRLRAKAYLGRGVTVYKASRDTLSANRDFRNAIAYDPYGTGILAKSNLNKIMTRVTKKPKSPVTFRLFQNYPNPFNSSTRIGYQLPNECQVKMSVYDITGRVVTILANENKQPGYYHVIWDGHDSTGRQVSSGVYMYRIRAGDFVETKRMLLLR